MTVYTLSPKEDCILHLPRILCLHGGGSNARIFRAQCRAPRAELSHHFRFVFADAPFSSEPGPDVTSVYKNFGPYRRWLRSSPHQPHAPAGEAVMKIEDALALAMDESDRQGVDRGVSSCPRLQSGNEDGRKPAPSAAIVLGEFRKTLCTFRLSLCGIDGQESAASVARCEPAV